MKKAYKHQKKLVIKVMGKQSSLEALSHGWTNPRWAM